MQFGKLTQKSQEALQAAQRVAWEQSHQEIDDEHLLLVPLSCVGRSLISYALLWSYNSVIAR
jgi:ATP-dependent Clp protease ATP-binding subunit ClpA